MENMELPCMVGDKVIYTDEYESFEFNVTDIKTSEDKTRIYGGTRGCIVYADEFDKYCKLVKGNENIKEKLLALLEEQYAIINRNLPDDDEDEECFDGEEMFDNGRFQGRFEMCKMVEKIINEE
jgi:hypothetical protein